MKNNLLYLVVLAAITVAIIVAFRNYGCEMTCGGPAREGMMAGLSTTSGLSFYNKYRQCYPGNLLFITLIVSVYHFGSFTISAFPKGKWRYPISIICNLSSNRFAIFTEK